MKPLLSLFLFVVISFYSNAQIVDIPDANFKNALIQADIDTNNDDEIQVSEAQAITSLDLSNRSIFDLTGISSFTSLEFLYCDYNELTSLDLTGLNNLLVLDCHYNQLTELNLNGLTQLLQIDAKYNNLASIDVSTLSSLSSLIINHNQVLSLDVSGLTNFENLHCQSNQILTLNLSNCPNLSTIRASFNNLTSLDFSAVEVSAIEYSLSNNNLTNVIFPSGFEILILQLQSNQLVDVDLSNVTNTGYITIENNPIETLNVKNGVNEIAIGSFGASDWVETLEFICVDDFEFNDVVDLLNQLSIDANVSPYCTFEPGGEYNRITGAIQFDLESNGCNASDAVVANVLIEINDGANQSYVTTNPLGDYNAYLEIGDYTIAPNIENADWFMTTPNSASISFVDNNNLSVQDFCIESVGVHQDVEIAILPIIPAQPGFDATYQIVYKNKGNQVTSGDIELSFDDTVLDYVSSSVGIASQTTGSLIWNYTNLNPFESRSITVTLNVNSPMEAPTVNIGDQLDFSVTINPISSDESPSDNMFNYKQEVIGSFDPNDITCLEGDFVNPDKITEYLHYNINFENTGTAAATFVVVKDVIDEANYDMSSLQIMYASHGMQTTVTDNTIEFIFDNINLGPDEKGNVVFKIKTSNTLAVGDSVENDAEIFFDYNYPIVTNVATTSFQALSVDEFGTDNSISVFPNPSKDIVTLKSKSNLKSIQVYDAMSRLVFDTSLDDLNYTLKISDYANGIYFLKINTEFGQKVERLIKN